MTFGSTAMPGILFAADARSLPRSQPDLRLESMPSAKFVSTEVTGCVSEPGWTCSVRSSEEEIIKRQIRNVNFTSFPKYADYPTPSIARGTARTFVCGWFVLIPNVTPYFGRKKRIIE